MSLTPNWMVEDNLDRSVRDGVRRAQRRALEICICTAFMTADRRSWPVGKAFARAKEDMSPDELAALQSITSFDNDLPCPSSNPPTSTHPV
jgi:hypothetical protein